MIMNLKRIIREEMDDMDWIKDIDTPQVGDTYKFIMSGQFNGQYKSNPWNIVITDIKEHPSRQVGYSVITLHYRLQSTTAEYMPILKDYEIYLDEFLTGVEEGRFVKIKEINESDDLQWIRDVRPIKYNIDDVIEPINGYFYYTKPWSEKYGPISGHVNAKIIDIVDEFYEIVLNYDIYEDILEAPTYYISIYDTDNKNLNESDDLQWMKEIPNTIIVGSCIKRIIREELETSLGTLYLLVSDDEKFIYGMGKFSSESFEPVENFNPEAILNSAHKSSDGAYKMVDWAKYYKDDRTITGRNNSGELTFRLTSIGKSANDILKHNPKVITVDFIIKKREEAFPIIESEEFDWIKDVDPDNVHIRDLEIGMKVIANCPPNKSLRTRELTVDSFFPKTKYSKHIKYRGQFCVHFKEFGKQVQPIRRIQVRKRHHVPVVTICEHLGCSFKLINKEIRN